MPAALSLRRATAVVAALAALSLLLPARGEAPRAEGERAPVRVGLVFDVGGRGDKSFNDAADLGLARAARELGVATEVLEPSGAEDREAAMRLFAARGFDLVIGVGFIFSTDAEIVARAFPATRFACLDYAPPPAGAPPENLAGLTFREEEGSFLVGAVAGLTTATGRVGFIGGMDIPLVHKFEAGYRAGVREVCPACDVSVAYAGTTPDAFRDPVKGKALAVSQAAAGADVLFHVAGATGHGVLEAARDMGVKAIGVDRDQHDEMPGTVLTSMIKRADVAVFEVIRALVEGRFEGGVSSFGLAEGGVGYVSEGPHAAGIPDATKARVSALSARIARGELVVPSR
ncbi:BMP family ABC transporter substrate-binding protein [Sorangium sp. So ce375]|uniref:BMP family lipoprotein n=1 Tax=Sorangium sp. So ce375 TaxID=3133306 RepID=UPI003F5C4361